MKDTKSKEIDKKIKELQLEIERLELERDLKVGIKPSETEALIKKWYGHAFYFEGDEYGSVEILLTSIKVDRKNERIDLEGNYILWITSDSNLGPYVNTNDINLVSYGGALLCYATINFDRIPYSLRLDWDESIYQQLDEYFKSKEISIEEFRNNVKEIDEGAHGNFDYIDSMESILKQHEEGNDFYYKDIFDKL